MNSFLVSEVSINATACVRVSLSCVVGVPLLRLLVQLHVRHQDVLLRLLRQAGVGPAVTGAFVGAPGPHSSPPVQINQTCDQRQQHQGRDDDDDEGGHAVDVRCGETEDPRQDEETKVKV